MPLGETHPSKAARASDVDEAWLRELDRRAREIGDGSATLVVPLAHREPKLMAYLTA
jgi:hypothetical protein